MAEQRLLVKLWFVNLRPLGDWRAEAVYKHRARISKERNLCHNLLICSERTYNKLATETCMFVINTRKLVMHHAIYQRVLIGHLICTIEILA